MGRSRPGEPRIPPGVGRLRWRRPPPPPAVSRRAPGRIGRAGPQERPNAGPGTHRHRRSDPASLGVARRDPLEQDGLPCRGWGAVPGATSRCNVIRSHATEVVARPGSPVDGDERGGVGFGWPRPDGRRKRPIRSGHRRVDADRDAQSRSLGHGLDSGIIGTSPGLRAELLLAGSPKIEASEAVTHLVEYRPSVGAAPGRRHRSRSTLLPPAVHDKRIHADRRPSWRSRERSVRPLGLVPLGRLFGTAPPQPGIAGRPGAPTGLNLLLARAGGAPPRGAGVTGRGGADPARRRWA